MEILFKKLSPDAITPTQANPSDAGWDFYSTEDKTLERGERHLFKTDIAVAIPHGYFGRLSPRSGLANKFGLDVLAGTIDSGYRANVGIILVNLGMPGELPIQIKRGDKICQMIITPCPETSWFEVEELPDSVRGLNGYGSSDKK